ncbi:efflux RND transporter periplasmic adaptor subunit [Cetobacterium sp. 8H]|uniref:efflux RND transporter periplasmic adaptor subunit n=1 Tax=Cetobacterium sp. 8H TaxID=2759681 RepID=UPI00163C87F5|nr:efflux RND transporter periplasmic adaptor subunit [Cetobacterium sp. 8H]MBC2850040.1 efflux RND transporter periplasmic adaptor subunit [Cetobacterium sp. 8H]
MKNKFIIFTSVILLFACGKSKNDKQEEVKPVVFEIVEPKFNMIKRTYSGTVNTEALSNLSFRVSGTINNRIAQLGDPVYKGDILATLDPIEYQVSYQKALADLDKGKASLTEASANFKRSEALYLENSISKASYDSATASYKSAISSVNALQEGFNLAKIQLGYTYLIAPSDGSIGEVKSEVNQSVTPNTTVFVLNTSGDRFVEFNVSQSVVGDLKLGDNVDITITSLNNLNIQGIITNIGTLSVGYGNTYPVKARIIDASDLVKVGMIAKVTVNTLAEKDKIISVPLTSILTAPDGSKYVFVIKDIQNNMGVVTKRIVTLGTNTKEGVEVTSGLTSGEYFVIKGSNSVLENQKVSLIKGAE